MELFHHSRIWGGISTVGEELADCAQTFFMELVVVLVTRRVLSSGLLVDVLAFGDRLRKEDLRYFHVWNQRFCALFWTLMLSALAPTCAFAAANLRSVGSDLALALPLVTLLAFWAFTTFSSCWYTVVFIAFILARAHEITWRRFVGVVHDDELAMAGDSELLSPAGTQPASRGMILSPDRIDEMTATRLEITAMTERASRACSWLVLTSLVCIACTALFFSLPAVIDIRGHESLTAAIAPQSLTLWAALVVVVAVVCFSLIWVSMSQVTAAAAIVPAQLSHLMLVNSHSRISVDAETQQHLRYLIADDLPRHGWAILGTTVTGGTSQAAVTAFVSFLLLIWKDSA